MSESKCGCIVKIALALGIASAIEMLLLGLAGMHGYGTNMINLLGSVYVGFAATVKGSIIGAIWAFVDTVIFILVAGFIYCLLGKCCGKGCASKCHSHSDEAPKS